MRKNLTVLPPEVPTRLNVKGTSGTIEIQNLNKSDLERIGKEFTKNLIAKAEELKSEKPINQKAYVYTHDSSHLFQKDYR